MEYRPFGRLGWKVSEVGYGMWGLAGWTGSDDTETMVSLVRSVELGVNFFDTADVYSLGVSEEITGRLLKELGPPRDQVVIATKVHGEMGKDPNLRGLSRKHIMHAIDDSLRRLGTDYVDLYQIHRFDPRTPIEETLEALNDVVRAGKALYIGASSMPAWRFAKMLATSDRLGYSRFVSMQNHYNLVYREEEREMIPLCREEGIGIIPWSPLARGFLVGNRRRQDRGETTRARSDAFAHALYYRDDDFAVVERVGEIAARRGVPNAQVALGWLLAQPGVTAPIIGASKPQHLHDAVAALSLMPEVVLLAAPRASYKTHPAFRINAGVP